ENRFNPDFLSAFIETLDAIEMNTDAATLIVHSAHEKIFSNGIDLEWLVPIIQKGDVETAKAFFHQLNQLFRRTVTSPLITVAAITGHAFAGGAIWSCAFDFRFMRSDRGYFCFPEVDLGIPFLPGMLALLKKAIPMATLERMHHLGVRLTAEECERERIVLKAAHIDALMDDARAFAGEIRKKRAVVAEMKQRFYKDVLHAIDVEDGPYIESGAFHIG
ncbi:MAG: enoyl-CoA hydratase/isomerase family protein, partial [Thermodesulfobacteriota bacterium]